MPRPTSDGLKPSRIKIAVALLGLDANGYRRTQKEVSDMLAIAKSTVNEAVGELIRRGCIRCTDDSRREKIYCKGVNFALLESQITAEILESVQVLNSVRGNGWAVTDSERATHSDAPSDLNTPETQDRSGPLPIAWDVHLNCEIPRFLADREGELFQVAVNITDPSGQPRTLSQTLFTRDSGYEIKGGMRWTGMFVMPSSDHAGRYKIEYHRTSKGGQFYVGPQFDVLMSGDDVNDMERVRTALVAACAPMLIWLEKHAGWVFNKDECGRYRLLTELRPDKIHRALRGPANDLLTELCGGSFGVSNEGIWADRSPGYTELETNNAAYAEAIIDLPRTAAKAEYAYTKAISTDKEIAELKGQISELVAISTRLVEVGHNILEAQTTGFRILSNQTALEMFQTLPDETPADARTLEGYH